MKKCMLNNPRMDMFRREQSYQAVIIDLALVGVIDKELAEKMLGYEIPDYIKPLVEVSHNDASANERLSDSRRRTRD